MNFTDAIKNVSSVQNKFDVSGGNLNGKLLMNNSVNGQINFKDSTGTQEVIGMYLTSENNLRFGGDGSAGKTVPGTITLECNTDPKFKKVSDSNTYTFYHTGNKPTPADIGAAPASHPHDYLPLTGGTVNGNINVIRSGLGCYITPDGLDSAKYGSYNMGDTMPLGYITCMSLTQMSDRNTKEEIKYINNNEDELTSKDCYEFFLNEFKPVSFKYIKRTTDFPQLGFIAQDLENTKLSNYVLVKKEDQLLTFNNYSFTSALAIAFQEALKEIKELKFEIEQLKNK